MKVYTFYLPQFHRVKENDEWWGAGFTDWVSAQSAKSLFEGHNQPHVPLNENYYDLMKKETMQWQADLMHKYGIDGQCIYHYWFENGKQILEKPAENLLKWKDIDMPFCFYWANETWARSWDNVGNKEVNVWTDSQSDNTAGENKILLNQKYGDKHCWKNHFDYLLPFFQDDRYIKKNGCPVFLIYRPQEISCLREMIAYWKQLAIKAGLRGLYVIGARCNTRTTEEIDAHLFHEPAMHIVKDSSVILQKVDYEDIYCRILREPLRQKRTYFGGFVGYDDTPRRGNAGIAICNGTPKKFEKYLTDLMAKNVAAGNDMVFINAWNEWGEGMHLEPDVENNYGYLECISKAKSNYQNKVNYYRQLHKDIPVATYQNLLKEKDKYEDYLNLLDLWMSLREKNIHISAYLKENDYHKVMLYGYGIYGRHLLRELVSDGIDVVGLADKTKINAAISCKVYRDTDKFPKFDVMIVTSFYYLDEIVREYQDRNYNIVSIEQILLELEEDNLGD